MFEFRTPTEKIVIPPSASRNTSTVTVSLVMSPVVAPRAVMFTANGSSAGSGPVCSQGQDSAETAAV